MATPYIGFIAETLRLLPDVKPGDMIGCDKCGKEHALEPDDNGGTLLMYQRASCVRRKFLYEKITCGHESEPSNQI